MIYIVNGSNRGIFPALQNMMALLMYISTMFGTFISLSHLTADPFRKFFLTDNLPFYTTLFNAFLQVLSARSPMNTIVVGLSNANPIDSAPCIGSSSMLDFNTLKMLLKNVYHCCPDLLLWLRVCKFLSH